MKTLILKRKALALSWALATVLALAFTQCKKEETPAVTPTDDTTETLTNAPILPQGETVHITLKVNQNNDEKLDVTPPHVNFENGDTLYVASDGKYVGYLLYVGSNSEFVGDITGATAGQPLYFYLLGNRGVNGISWTVANEVTTGCSLDISNQHDYFAGQPANKQLPVVSCAPSNEDFAAGAAAQDFTAILCNQCALVKFKTNVISGKVTLGNMYNKANVNFATKTITPAATTGSISFATDADGVGWVILLPHDGAITATASAAGYDDTSVTIPAINNNAYLSDGIAVNLEAFYPLATPLTFEAITAGASVTFTKGKYAIWTNPVEYSLNGGAWTEYASGTGITLTNVGDKVSFRGNNVRYASGDIRDYYSYFSCDEDCYIYGNVMSLVNKDDFATNTNPTLTGTYTFCHLFGNFDSSTNQNAPNPHLYNHSSKTLVLPATTLASSCYNLMFSGCTSLTTAPALPATTLRQFCYYKMFEGCTSLTTVPSTLPATTLFDHCYGCMFQGCTRLTTAPTLPATTLATRCYWNMFKGCTSLTTAPQLLASTLTDNCYRSMFEGCSNLNNVTCLATNISASDYTTDWLSGVAATGTFTKASGITWPSGASGIPSGWTVQNAP